MPTYSINNFSVYQGENMVYIANGDHNLFKVTGNSAAMVSSLLVVMRHHSAYDDIYEHSREFLDDDKDMFDQLLQWLLSNNIITEHRREDEVSRRIATHVYSSHLTEDEKEEVLSILSNDKYQYQVSPLEIAEFILVISPLFDNYSEVKSVNEYAFKNVIPVCHLGVDTETFTMGPIFDPELNTPCMRCYSNRKMSNMDNPRETFEFIKFTNKERIADIQIMESPYFKKILLTYLGKELSNYFNSEGILCQLVGRSITFDHVNYTTSKSKIIRTQGCDVCNVAVLAAPLNA